MDERLKISMRSTRWSLRAKTMGLIVAILVGLIILLYAVSQILITRQFSSLERDTARDDLQHTLDLLADSAAQLEMLTADWAVWDDTYRFMAGDDAQYLDENIIPTTFARLDLDLIAFLDDTGQVLYGQESTADAGQTRALIPAIPEYLAALDQMSNADPAAPSISGVMMLPHGPFLVAAHAVVSNTLDGPPIGTLIFGRTIDANRLAELATPYDATAVLLPLDDPSLSEALTQDAPDTELITPTGDDTIEAYALIPGVADQPDVALRLTLPRAVYRQGRSTMIDFLAVTILVGVGFAVLLILLIERLILARIARLNHSLRQIGQRGDPSARVPVNGNDELTTLAETLNSTFDALQQSQQTLADSQRRLHQIVTSINDTVLTIDFDRNGAFKSLWLPSSQIPDLTGYPPDKLDQGPEFWRTITHPDDRAIVRAHYRRLHAAQDAEAEYRLVAANGDAIWVRDSGHAEALPDGETLRVFSVLSIITARKQAEEALRDSEEQLSRVLEGSRDAFWDWDLTTGYVRVNSRWAEMLGYEPGEVDPHVENWQQLIHPDERATVMAQLNAHINGETPTYECEYRLRTRSGDWMWVLDRGTIVAYDEHQKPVRMAGAHTDIMARKEAEEALRASEERIRSILSAIPDLMFQFDRDGTYLDAYAGNQQLLLHPRDEIIGHTLAELLPADVAEKILRAIHRTLATGEMQIFTYQLEVPPLTYDFEARMALSGPDQTLMIVRDVTDRTTVEAERNRLLHEMEARATELATVAEVSLRAATILDLDRLLATVTELTRENFDLYQTHIFLLDEEQNTLVLAAASSPTGRMLVERHYSIPLDHPQSVTARAARNRTSAVVNDTRSSTEHLPHPTVPDTRAEMAIPMIVGHDLIGVLDVQSDQVNKFTVADSNVMTTLAAQIAIAIHNARLFTENKRRLSIIENSTDCIALASLESTPYYPNYVNPAGLKITGYSSVEAFCSHPIHEFYSGQSVHVLAQEALPTALEQGLWRGESMLRRQDGTLVPVEQSLFVIRDRDGNPRDLATIVTDISSRKESEEALHRASRAFRLLSECNQAVARAVDERSMLWQICQSLVDEGTYQLAWVGLSDPDGSRLVPVAYVGDEAAYRALTAHASGESSALMQPLEEPLLAHLAEGEAGDAWRAAAQAHGLASGIALPLANEQEPSFGVLQVYSTRPDAFDDEEIALLTQLASDMAFGINALHGRIDREKALIARREQYILTEALRDTADAINSTLDPDVVLDRLLDNLKRVVPHDAANITLIDHDTARVVRAREYTEHDVSDWTATTTMTIGPSSIVHRVLESGAPLIVPYTAQDPDWADFGSWIASYACAPIRREGQVIGLVNVYSVVPNFFKDRHTERLQAFGDQAAIAIQNAQLFTAERDQRILAEALSDTTAAVNSTLEFDEVLDRILTNVGRVVPHHQANIMLVEPDDTARVVRHRGYNRPEHREWITQIRLSIHDTPSLHHMIETGRPIAISDVTKDPNWIDHRPIQSTRSYAGAPILRNGEVVGFLSLDSAIAGFYTQIHAERLQAFADQAAIAIHNARLYEAAQHHAAELQAQAQRLALINRVSTRLAQTLDIQEIYRIVLTEAQQALKTSFGGLVIFEDETTGNLVYGTHADDALNQSITIPLVGNRSIETVRETRKPLVSEDVLRDPLFEPAWDVLRLRGTRSLVIVPLVVGTAVIGTLGLDCTEPRTFTETEIELLHTIATQGSIAISKAQLYDAEHDQRVLAEALRDTAAAINTTLNFDEVLDRILDNVGRVVPHDAANVMLIEDGVAHIERGHGYAERGLADWIKALRYLTADVPIWQHMMETGQPFAVPDTHAHPDWIIVEEEAWIRSTVKAPIQLDDKIIGILHLDSATPNAFTQADAGRLQAFADQAATAIRNAQLFAAERDQRALAEALRDTAGVVNSSLNFDDVLEGILANVERVAPHDSANIMLINGDYARVARAHTVPPDPDVERLAEDNVFYVPDTANLRHMVATGEPVTISDTASYDGWIVKESTDWIRSQAGAPIKQNNRVIGFLTLDSRQPNFYTQEQSERLQAFADQVATAIRNAQLFTAESDQRVLAEALRDTAAALNSTLNFDELLDRILTNVGRVVPHDSANIMLIEDGIARAVRSRGYAERGLGEWLKGIRFPVNEIPNLREMVETKQAHTVSDTRVFRGWALFEETSWIRSYSSVPIRLEGEVIGFINLDSITPGYFTGTHTERLQAFADQVALAIRNVQLYDEIQHHAAELEQRVAERTAELETQRAQLQTILEAMGEGVIYTVGTQVSYVNPATLALFGFKMDDLFNHTSEVYHHLTNTVLNYDQMMGDISKAFERGESWRGEARLTRKNGDAFDAALTISQVVSLDTQQKSVVTMVRDISQQKALQEQKDRFIANASHELRTPLANIKTRLYLIRRQPEKLSAHLEVLDRVTSSMTELIENMLDVSRFERGIIALYRRTVDLQPIIEEVVAIQQPEAERKNITISTDLPAEPLHISADPQRFSQVITNLITNAINYTAEDGQIAVAVEKEPPTPDAPQGRAVIHVRDTGVGIAPSLLSQVFEPFFRANEGTSTGTGLGLTIVREIVHLHDGELDVQSSVGEGSTFTIKLNLVEE